MQIKTNKKTDMASKDVVDEDLFRTDAAAAEDLTQTCRMDSV